MGEWFSVEMNAMWWLHIASFNLPFSQFSCHKGKLLGSFYFSDLRVHTQFQLPRLMEVRKKISCEWVGGLIDSW